jgi:hypothetical protein
LPDELLGVLSIAGTDPGLEHRHVQRPAVADEPRFADSGLAYGVGIDPHLVVHLDRAQAAATGLVKLPALLRGPHCPGHLQQLLRVLAAVHDQTAG